MQSTTKGMMRADPIGMIVSSSGSFLLLSPVFVCRRHFFRIITDRDYQTTSSFQKRGGKDDVNGDERWNIIIDR